MKHIKDIERLESILASGSKSRRSDAAYRLCGAGEQNGRENAGKARQCSCSEKWWQMNRTRLAFQLVLVLQKSRLLCLRYREIGRR